ncbi:MAG: hypothetical protein ACYTEZ_06705 [Planctomycetota bacterium]|jgi:hypothetical protein
MAALLALVLLAPGVDRQWSAKHGVGMWVPQQWKVVARDQGDRALVVEGPKLGPGVPRAVLWDGGSADRVSLDAFAGKVVAEVAKRPGWQIVVQARKRIGPFPCVRVGIRFAQGEARGRARFTVALLGGGFYVLELSAAASHFPGTTFDRIEQSLAVRWSEIELERGLVVEVPAGWQSQKDGGALRLTGPRLGGARYPMVIVEHQPAGLTRPPTARPGPAIEFLGAKREAVQDERKLEGHKARLVLVHAHGWTGAVMLPLELWDDLFPVAEAILAGARVPKKEKR